MKRTSYGERDYAFVQRMLRLRTSIGLTQAGLAQRLRMVFCWLAILREPVSLEELLAVLCTPRTAL